MAGQERNRQYYHSDCKGKLIARSQTAGPPTNQFVTFKITRQEYYGHPVSDLSCPQICENLHSRNSAMGCFKDITQTAQLLT